MYRNVVAKRPCDCVKDLCKLNLLSSFVEMISKVNAYVISFEQIEKFVSQSQVQFMIGTVVFAFRCCNIIYIMIELLEVKFRLTGLKMVIRKRLSFPCKCS